MLQSSGSRSGHIAEPVRLHLRSAAPHPRGPGAACAGSSDAVRAPHRRDARTPATVRRRAQRRHGDARGLEVSPVRLLKNQLVQRQIGNRFAQPAILSLKLLQTLDLFDLQPAKLLAPPIIRHLTQSDLTDRLCRALALRNQHINLPKLRYYLLRLVSFPWHCSPPRCQKTYLRVDHFSEGGSVRHCGSCPTVRHVRDVDASLVFKQLRRQM